VNAFVRTVALFSLFASLFLVPIQAGAIAVDQSKPAVPSKSWQQMTMDEKIQFDCAVTAAVVFFIAEIWFIVAGFKVSVGWGLFMLFIGGLRSVFAVIALLVWLVLWGAMLHEKQAVELPMIIGGIILLFMGGGAILFMVRHWDQARGPFKTMMFGIVLIAVVVGLQARK